MFEDDPCVLDGAGQRALLGAGQLLLPFVRVGLFLRQRVEALQRVVEVLLSQQGRRGAVALGQRPHLLPAGQGRGGRAGGGICVQIAELVDAHQIPCVQQLAACGVGAVVAVDEGVVVVKHRARRGAACGVSQAILPGIDVLPGQKLCNCRPDVVSPAESAHHALLGGGVGLLAAG